MRHQKQVNFDTYAKTKYFSTPTLKPSKFRSLHWNQVTFDPPHSQVNFDPYTKTKSFSTPPKKQVNSDPRTKNKSILIPILKPS